MPSTIVSVNRPKHLPTALTHAEALDVIEEMTGVHQLMAKRLYGSGLRLMECIRLRERSGFLKSSDQFS
jgi:integrase